MDLQDIEHYRAEGADVEREKIIAYLRLHIPTSQCDIIAALSDLLDNIEHGVHRHQNY